jgi:phospholipid transport system transporter-binding protein
MLATGIDQMNQVADIIYSQNQFILSGHLCMANVMAIYKKSLSSIPGCNELIFDFSQLASSDSSGIALIVEWMRLANKLNKKITFHYLSNDLMALARASSLDKIL